MSAAVLILLIAWQGVPGSAGLTAVHAEPLANGLLVMGVNQERQAVVRLVEPATGKIRTEVTGMSPRWIPGGGVVLVRQAPGWFALHVDTGRLEGPLTEDDVAARSIRFGGVADRSVTLQRLQSDASLRNGPLVRAALLDRLSTAAAEPLPKPGDEKAMRVRRTRERELEMLVDIVGQFRLPETAPLIAATGASAGALLNIGKPSIRAILDAWPKVPADAGPMHRFRLLTALRQLVVVFPDAVTTEIADLVRAVLNRPPDAESLKEAIRFADDLDDATALRLVRAYAEDPMVLKDRVPAAEAPEVQKAAQRVLERRIVLR